MIWIGVFVLIAIILTVVILLAYKFRRRGDRDVVIGPAIFLAFAATSLWGAAVGAGYSSDYNPDTFGHQKYQAGTFAEYGGVKDPGGKYVTVTQKSHAAVDTTVQFVYKVDGRYQIVTKSADEVVIRYGDTPSVERFTFSRQSRVFVPWTSTYTDMWQVTVPKTAGSVDYVGKVTR